MLLQALCSILSPYVKSNWSYSPEIAKLGFDLCDLELCTDIPSVNGYNS